MRVVDNNGQIIRGLVRTTHNGLAVDDQTGYHKYLKEKQRLEEIEVLKQDVSEIKEMLKQLLKAQNG